MYSTKRVYRNRKQDIADDRDMNYRIKQKKKKKITTVYEIDLTWLLGLEGSWKWLVFSPHDSGRNYFLGNLLVVYLRLRSVYGISSSCYSHHCTMILTHLDH